MRLAARSTWPDWLPLATRFTKPVKTLFYDDCDIIGPRDDCPNECRSGRAIGVDGSLSQLSGEVFRVVTDIENAKTFSGIGIDIKNTNLLTGARSFPAFSDLVRDRDLTGRKNKDSPRVWQLGGAVPVCALFSDAASD